MKNYHTFVGLIFFVVAFMHALRLMMGWTVVISGFDVPMWISGGGVIVAGYLSWASFKLNK